LLPGGLQANAAAVGAYGDDPQTISNPRSLQYVRDSVFHSYLDSLDLRIETLNRAARTVDSLARTLRNSPSLKIHVNGHCFGPIHIPSQGVGADSLSISTPEINIPEIEIPDIDIEVPHVGGDGTMLYPMPDRSQMIHGSPGTIIGITSNESPSYYYQKGDTRYYIRNVQPRQHSMRAPSGSNVWLLSK
jgi:hypothetical protein